MNDKINHPSHYNIGKFECIDVMEDAFGTKELKTFCVMNAFKYIYRHKQKGGAEDIKKAVCYLNKYLSLDDEQDRDGRCR